MTHLLKENTSYLDWGYYTLYRKLDYQLGPQNYKVPRPGGLLIYANLIEYLNKNMHR